MHIAVVPASSSTCTEAIRQLLGDKSGPSITGIYRNLAKVPSEFASHPNFRAVKGDVNDASSLDITGCDAVLALTPPTYDDTDIIKHAKEVSQTVKDAIERAGSIRRLVYVSSVGAEFAEGVGEIKTNHIAESIFRDAAPEVIFVRCAYFMENWASAMATIKSPDPYFFSTITPLDYKVPMVGAADRGQECAAQLLATEVPDRGSPYIFELQGPQWYSALDVQEAFEEILGTKIGIKPVAKDELEGFYAQVFPPSTVSDWVEMNLSFLSGGILVDHMKNPVTEVVKGKTVLVDILRQISGTEAST